MARTPLHALIRSSGSSDAATAAHPLRARRRQVMAMTASAVALACAAEHAPQLVYAQGVDPREAAATPIGVTCRLCNRADCAARAVPPVGRDILSDEYRRAPSPFSFDDV